MREIALEEWQLRAESPVPGWTAVEHLMRAASMESEVVRLLVLEPDGTGAYRTRYRAEAPFIWEGDVEATVRGALRRDAFVALIVRRPGIVRSGLRHYQCERRRVLTGDALAPELGGRLPELEAFLEGAPLLMLAGHDGDPVFLLSGPAST
jgi:hypothetical protein